MTSADGCVPDRPRGLDALVAVLAAEFPVYFFATQPAGVGRLPGRGGQEL